MYDIKVSHIDPVIFTNMGEYMKKTYKCVLNEGSRMMKLAHGKINEYLGMTLDF